jgi:hypothetical protein
MAGFSARLNLDNGAGVLEDTLISGATGDAKDFLRSWTVFIVGTAGEVTALDSGREPGFGWLGWIAGRVTVSVDP